ncbi:MAG: tRNA lysidine(34) synthetase TilS [Alphaproteobacteria bacterium]|nr:tRNA lysidine(34) synthetase TilS [Alphaproteobacteria bacterium]
MLSPTASENPIALAAPLGLAEFAEQLERLAVFETAPFVAVAVSGGPDSLALAILADYWARRRGGWICALSVDHGLRPESGAELRQVAEWLAARSIRHEILVWDGKKPRSRIQEAARTARYRLLGEWCRLQGCLHLLIGHHREDQVETYWLRRAARSGPDGLAAMSAVREIDGCRILRPLLDIAKTRLVATLAAENQSFLSDPSNRNPAFARARLRQNGTDANVEVTLAEVRERGRERVTREHACCALLARAVALHPAGFAVLDPEVLLAAPPEVAEQALSALVTGLGASRYAPRRRSLARLRLTLAGAAAGGRVLGGYRFVAWRGRILVLRELAAAAAPVLIAPGDHLSWDGRFAISLPIAARPLTVGYLGEDGLAALHHQPRGPAPSLLPALIHPVLLGFWDKHGLAAVPTLGYVRDQGAVVPRLAFRPVNCMSHASFVVV